MNIRNYFRRILDAAFQEPVDLEREDIDAVLAAYGVDLNVIRPALPHMMTSYRISDSLTIRVMKPKQFDTALYHIRAIDKEDVQRSRSDPKILDFDRLPERKRTLFAKRLKNFSMKNVKSYYDPESFYLKMTVDCAHLINSEDLGFLGHFISGSFSAIPKDSYRQSGVHPSEVLKQSEGTPVRALFDVPLHRVPEIIDRFGEEGKGLEKLV